MGPSLGTEFCARTRRTELGTRGSIGQKGHVSACDREGSTTVLMGWQPSCQCKGNLVKSESHTEKAGLGGTGKGGPCYILRAVG